MEYFKELEDEYLNKTYIIINQHNKKSIIPPIPNEFYIKYNFIFTSINKLNNDILLKVMNDKYNEQNNIMQKTSSITNYQIKKQLLELFQDEYYQNKYFTIIDLFTNIKTWSYHDLINILYFYKDLLEAINFTDNNLLKNIEMAISELEELIININISEYQKISLPDCWYILPKTNGIDNMLYNTTGKDGHKDANLIYVLNYIFGGMICTKELANQYFDNIKKLQQQDFISYNSYMSTIKIGNNNITPFLDHNGEKNGLRELLLTNQQNLIANLLESQLSIVLKDKQNEIKSLIDDYKQYFNIYNHNGLPFGIIEILNNIIKYSKKEIISKKQLDLMNKYSNNKTLNNLTLESYTNIQYYQLLLYIKKELDELNIDIDKYQNIPTYIYNQMAKKLVIGCNMAHAILIKNFAYLYNHTNNYYDCLNFLSKYNMDDLLVRFCGFNKVVRQTNKTDCFKEIITSNLNYEEEFKEYQKHGWKIHFIPPIRINEETKSLREMDEFWTVKTYHK